jgi:copper chaperone CopZ
MKETVVKVDWLLQPEDSLAVEKYLALKPGIESVGVNPVNGVAHISYDENLVEVDDVIRFVLDRGYHCHRLGTHAERGREAHEPTAHGKEAGA